MINFGFCNILINFTQHIDLINMKKRDFKAGVVAALGTALVASCGTTSAAQEINKSGSSDKCVVNS